MPGYDGVTFQGVPFHGEFSATDATTTASTAESTRRFALYTQGAVSATTVNSGDQVIVTDVTISNSVSSGQQITIYDGADVDRTSGELIGVFRPASLSLSFVFATPHFCVPGTYPKVIAGTSGQVDVMIRGVIKRGV